MILRSHDNQICYFRYFDNKHTLRVEKKWVDKGNIKSVLRIRKLEKVKPKWVDKGNIKTVLWIRKLKKVSFERYALIKHFMHRSSF